MSKTVLVEWGGDYLPKVEIPELEEMYRCERPSKSIGYRQPYSESGAKSLRQ